MPALQSAQMQPVIQPNSSGSSQRFPPHTTEVFTAADRFQQYGLDPDVYSDPRPNPPVYRQSSQSPVLTRSHSSPHPYQMQQHTYPYPYPPTHRHSQPAPHPYAYAYAYSQHSESGSPSAGPQQQQPHHPLPYPYAPGPGSYYPHPDDAAGGEDDFDFASYTSSPLPSDTEPAESPVSPSLIGGAKQQRRAPLIDQPLTVDGKPRERVWVACDRCRVRKLGCDGAKPACHHCQRLGEQCRYDAAPKRRGQDKLPRTRSANGTRRERRKAGGGSGSGSTAGYPQA